MTEIQLKYLMDIQIAIKDLNGCLSETLSFGDFVNDFAMKRVAERQFEIIGEAIRKYIATENAKLINHSKKIIGLRNIIAHAYDSVDYELLWSIIKNDLPLLNQDIDSIIKSS